MACNRTGMHATRHAFSKPKTKAARALLLSFLTLDTVSAGLHCSLRISKQILPLLLMFGWYTFVWKLTCKCAEEVLHGEHGGLGQSINPKQRYLGWLERVIRREMDFHHEHPTSIRTVTRPARAVTTKVVSAHRLQLKLRTKVR